MHVVVNASSSPVYKKYRIASLLCTFETPIIYAAVLYMYDTLYAILNNCETPLMSELISSLCLKLYSLNIAITHAQKRLLGLSEFVILLH